jgi:arginyl-tRNA synthetase
LLLAASKSGVALNRAVESGEPAHMARYAFQLAQAFNSFYHDYPVLQEPDAERRACLLWMTMYFRDQLARSLDILGIPLPSYM